ncbi:ribosomal maturation YjgA family protein [Agromyces cerinus]|uniref:DUF2809 domain-containing protein n=1 Tax=Agromyces cerinus subsp. cerinus TaxID=232089 RepID=A0A1N6GPT7_9MICO|nr:DUF2809 domain-containing protein [Agromyces cerinus]SIO09530.1 Protein of unknown function [Agromyces cerinus subsp. cerinus]
MALPKAGSQSIRVRSGLAAAVSLALGLGLQLLDRTPVIDVLGSVVYIVFIACVLRAIWPGLGAVAVAATAFGFATAVELLQLTEAPQLVVDAFPPSRLLLGSAFDPIDVFAYAGGAVLAYVVLVVWVGTERVVASPVADE